MNEIKPHYFDASVIVKLFIEEEYSDVAKRIYGETSARFTTSLCFAESLAVIKKKSLKKSDTKAYLDSTLELIEIIKDGGLQIEEQNIFSREIYDEAELLVNKYKIDLADIFQIISIERSFMKKHGMKCTLVTADKDLHEAAIDRNLSSINIRTI